MAVHKKKQTTIEKERAAAAEPEQSTTADDIKSRPTAAGGGSEDATNGSVATAAVPWSVFSTTEVIARLQTDPARGLDTAAVAQRRLRYGFNEFRAERRRTIPGMLVAQFSEFLVVLLAGAGVISFLLGEKTDAVVILIVLCVNAVLGVIQEYRAEKSMAALKTLTAPVAWVLREEKISELPARELVPGDIIIIDTGDLIPADARLLQSANLQVNQSALTGEAEGVAKDAGFQDPGPLHQPLPLADRANLVHLGTSVTGGRARAVVIATGMETEIGRIAGMIQTVPTEKTPLQKKLDRLGKQLGALALLACAIIFALGILQGNDYFTMFLVAVSLAVAAIPEGLPAIVTIVLALGVQRMARRKAIIRRLPAVEALGAATVICADKTGTLTQNAMTVRCIATTDQTYTVTGAGYESEGEFLPGKQAAVAVDPAAKKQLSLLLGVACLNCNAKLIRSDHGGPTRVAGDPTEGALVAAAEKAGFCPAHLEAQLPRQYEYPFDPERKRCSTVHSGPLPWDIPGLQARRWLFTKGAPDLILNRCSGYLAGESIHALDRTAREQILAQNREMASSALRVLAVALRPFETAGALPEHPGEAEQDLVFLGLAGLIDPPRPEAARALEISRRAGIKVKMITGDHRFTALAVGRSLGLVCSETEVITGAEMDCLSREELAARVNTTGIFARVSPEHKLRIVDALQEHGEIVAMTGDGVNDAPALKKADIGVAMGLTGTGVAREAAEMILADDNFATIVSAVREGRIIFDNIRKAVFFLFSCNVGEILVILTAILLRWPLPLLPVQILWVNLVTDSLPALALGVDPPEHGIMDRPPRKPGESIFTPGIIPTLTVYALYITAITLIAFLCGQTESIERGRSMAFATLALSQLVHVFNFRSLEGSVLNRELFANRSLLGAVLLPGILQVMVFFVPFLAKFFRVVPLERGDWLKVALLSLPVLLFGELWKAIKQKVSLKK